MYVGLFPAAHFKYHSPPGTTWGPHGNRREPAKTDMSVRNRKRVTREQPQCDKGVTTQIVVTQKLSWASKVAFTKYRSETWNRRSQEHTPSLFKKQSQTGTVQYRLDAGFRPPPVVSGASGRPYTVRYGRKHDRDHEPPGRTQRRPDSPRGSNLAHCADGGFGSPSIPVEFQTRRIDPRSRD